MNTEDVNQDIIKLIQSSGIGFEKTGMVMSDNYGKVMIISSFNMYPDYGWLSKLHNMEGTITKTHCVPTDSGTLIARCNEEIRNLNTDINMVRDESVRQAKETAIETTRKLIAKINGKSGEMVVYCTVLLLVQAYSRELLNDRVKEVQSIVAAQGHVVRPLTMYQEDGFLSISPYGMVKSEISDIGERNMPMSSFWGGFPNAANGINDGRGIVLARTPEGKMVIIDLWKRGNDRINSNWIITGEPGTGKSTAVKYIIEYQFATGVKQIIFDPEKEYRDITNNVQGIVVNCGSKSKYRINPLQVRVLPEDDEDDSTEDKLYADKGHGVGHLAMHFQFLRSFFKMYKKEMTDLEMDELEIVLEKVYNKKGITYETDCTSLKPTDYPILKELYEQLLSDAEQNPENKELGSLCKRLRSICIGADSYMWNGYTNMDIDSDLIDLDVSSLIDADEGIKRAQYFNILTWVWGEASGDRTQKVAIYVDETYLLIDPEVPMPMICLRNYSKRLRKYEGALVIITHAVSDLLDREIKRFGQAILDNACYKLIMGSDGKNFQETKELYNFTEEEENVILSKQRGRGLLFAGNTRLIADVVVPKELLAMMGTAGGR